VILCQLIDRAMSSTATATSSHVPQAFSHQLKQLKFIVAGGLGTYFLSIPAHVNHILFPLPSVSKHSNSARLSSALAVGLGTVTITLLLYLVLLPRVKHIQIDYNRWRASPGLATIITLLTATIVSGWSLLVYALARGSDLGFWKSLIGATSIYILSFGLIGLIPVPRRQ